VSGSDRTSDGLGAGIRAGAGGIHANLPAAQLVESALRRSEGRLTPDGAFVASTAPHTGRSASDKFIVRDELTRDTVWWDNTRAMSREHFALLEADFLAHANGRELFSQELLAGSNAAPIFSVEVFTETAWHALFIRQLLVPAAGAGFVANATIFHLPSFRADPARHGTRTPVVIALDLSRNVVLIGGTAYAGEIKKSVFSLFNYHAPDRGILPMHCAANAAGDGSTALFFGLSGTGKTTLSTDSRRALIGDDEHGWGADGVFNLEGGCYAKTAKLDPASEPEIFAATKRFGAVLENVATDAATGIPDFDDITPTENGRAAYPLSALAGTAPSRSGGTPRSVILLTADAFGVLPPIARLTPEQALYYFISGYTAKLAGTERGVTEPQATFSTCFGAPFMSRHPMVYGRLLQERLAASGADCWLVNTGWTGGAYGTGKRMPIAATRRLVEAALSGELAGVPMRTDPVFGLAVPAAVPGVDSTALDPRASWPCAADYDAAAARLSGLFAENIKRFGLDSDAGDRRAPLVAAE
jgi:phosphoenolpyruvate carboxykinase (ATP)